MIKNSKFILLIMLFIETMFLSIFKNAEITLSLMAVLVTTIIFLILTAIYKNKKLEFVLLITIISAIIFMPYLLKINIFCFFNDQYIQYDYIAEEWNRLLLSFFENGSLPFYSFNSFLGNNFYASKAYYLTGDVFQPLILMFRNVNEAYLLESIIMFVLSGLFSYVFLESFGISNNKVITTTSLIYAFSGVAAFFTSEYCWHRFYVVFPLLLYGVEIYREKKKTIIFSLSVCLCFLMNYYFMFTATIFLVPYFLFTFYFHNNKTCIKSVLFNSIRLIVSYFFGFLLSGAIMIPAFISILGNKRVGSGVSSSFLFDFKIYLGYLYNLVIAPLSIGTTYSNNFVVNNDYQLWGYTIYSTSIIAPITFSYLFTNQKDYKNKVLKIFVYIMTVVALIPITNSIMHGFSGPSMRWTFINMFVYLIGFACFFDERKPNAHSYIKGLIIYCITFIIFTTYAIANKNMIINANNIQFINACVCVIMLFMLYLLLKNNKITIVLMICCLESILMFVLYISICNLEYRFYDDSLDRNVISYINDQDEDKFYRNSIDYNNLKPFVKDLNLNQSLHYGYKSIESYDTTYENNLNEFLEMNGINTHIIELTNPEVLKMLGVRYYYVLDESELPNLYNFTYVTDNNNFKVYKLDDYRPIGFTYSLFSTNKEYIVNNNLWNTVLYVDDELYSAIDNVSNGKNYNFNLTEYYDDNNLKGNINIDEKRVLFFSVPYNDGWKVKDNGEVVRTYKVQGGFVGIVLEPGEHYIELNFVPPGFKIGCIASLAGLIGVVITFMLEKKKKMH